MRIQRSLSGTWQFQLDPDGTVTVDTLRPSRSIAVPLPWQAAFPELQTYSGFAWYRRSADAPGDWLDGEVLLHFGAVDYWCQVFVNGHLAGEHEGGYTPFKLPIRSYLRPGANEIAVRVYDPVQAEIHIDRWPERTSAAQPKAGGPPFDAVDVPHGKQEWYLNIGGIWQDVVLIAVPRAYITSLHVTPDIHSGQVRFAIQLDGDAQALYGATLEIAVLDAGGQTWQTAVPLTSGQRRYRAEIRVEQPRLWQTDDPYLYRATATLHIGPGEDNVSTRFGFREISTRAGKILLNGEPIFLLAALDQDFYPETIYTVPSEDFLRREFQTAKQLGLNCLRCHIKPPDPRYLDLADEIGLLVWEEIPSWRTLRPKGQAHPQQLELDETIRRRVEQTLEDMVARDFNHPSIILWTMVNEDWGTSLPLSAIDRAWVARLYDRCKALDPTRLVVDNSACPHPWGPNLHIKSDLDDFHMYANIPDQALNFVQAIDQFNLRPLWSYSSHGDAQRTGDEPLVLSEFGNWGLPSLQQLRRGDGKDPSWFITGPWWSPWEGDPGWPAGVEDRFHKLGLDQIWPDYESFAAATQWHQFEAMKFEIETLRRQPALAGYVITEFSDIYWESNGLLDFHRHPKVYDDQFASINAPDVIVPQTASYACWDDRSIQVQIHGAHYSPAVWFDTRLSWHLAGTEAHSEFQIQGLERGEAGLLGEQRWDLPHVERAEVVQFLLALRDGSNHELARNHLDVLVLPARTRQPGYQGRVAVIPPFDEAAVTSAEITARPLATAHAAQPQEPAAPELTRIPAPPSRGRRASVELGWALRRMGYTMTNGLMDEAQVAVTNFPNAELLHWVRQGGRLLFLCNGPSPFYWYQSRVGAYSGSWITSFSWLRPGVYRRLQVRNPLGLPFMHIMPRGTILGLPVEDRAVQADFLSGMIAGWLQHPAVHTVQFRYGQGIVIMTTFALDEALPGDPVAVALVHDLIDHLASEACDPVLEANYG